MRYVRNFFFSEGRKGESLEHYVAELKKMGKNCNYGILINSMVRDNTIYHTTDTTLQQLVLKNQDLQLKTLIK
jgi:hypothetical protein